MLSKLNDDITIKDLGIKKAETELKAIKSKLIDAEEKQNTYLIEYFQGLYRESKQKLITSIRDKEYYINEITH